MVDSHSFFRGVNRAVNVFLCNAIACCFLIYMFDFGMNASLLGVIALASVISVCICSVKKHGVFWIVFYFLAVGAIAFLLRGQLIVGMKGFIDQFVKTVSSSKNMEIDMDAVGEGMEGQFAVIAVAEALTCMLLSIAYTAKKNYYGWLAVTGCILIVAMILNVFPPPPIVIAFFLMVVYLKITSSLEYADSTKVLAYCTFSMVLLILAAMVGTAIWSEEKHEDSLRNGDIRRQVREWNENIGIKVGRFMSQHPLPVEDSYAGMSGGSVSKGPIKSTNRTDLTVYMPANSPATYLKGYTGVTYRNSQWIEEDVDARRDAYRISDNWSRTDMFMDSTLSAEIMWEVKQAVPGSESYFPVYSTYIYVLTMGANKAYSYVPYNSFYAADGGYFTMYNPSGLPNIMAADGTLMEESAGLSRSPEGEILHRASQEFMQNFGMEECLTVGGDFRIVLDPVIKEYYNDYLPKHPAENYNDILQGKIDFVKQYLRENYIYTTTPPKNTVNKDPVMFFIQDSHAGYCQHFASTAIMLLRLLDVPCRYAEGYIVHLSDISKGKAKSEVLPNDSHRYGEVIEAWGKEGEIEEAKPVVVNVPNGNSHAWAEIWINDYGWYPIEATVGYESTVRNWEIPTPKPTQNPGTPTPSPNQNPTKAPTKAPTAGPAKNDQKTGSRKIGKGILIGLAAAVVLAVFAGYVSWTRTRRRRRFLSKNVRFAVKAIYEEIVRIADHMGVHRGGNEPNREFHIRLAEELPEVDGDVSFEEIAEIAERASYSAEKVTDEDRSRMLLYYRKIREQFLSGVNPFRRAYLRIIRGL